MPSFFEKLKLKKTTEKTEPTKTKPVKSAVSDNSNKKKNQEPMSAPLFTCKRGGGILKKLEIKTTPIDETSSHLHPSLSSKARLIELSEEDKKQNSSLASATEKDNVRIETIRNSKEWFEAEGQLAVDFFQTEQEFIVQSAIAGVKPEELEITVEDDMIIISGIRKKLELDIKTSQDYLVQECYWGRFSRKIILPEEVDLSRIVSTMEQGILTIRVPKVFRERKKSIKVKG